MKLAYGTLVMRVSIVIVTHNRLPRLRTTLRTLFVNPTLGAAQPTADPLAGVEIIVVDNGSTDGTTAALASEFPCVRVLARPTNEGVAARNHAFAVARGQYVMLIDDDSYPVGDAAARSMAYMDAHPRCAAVVGRVVLPSGACEASAFPSVMINCAVCLRKSVLDQVGGFPPEFFRQAEEYDLSFRIWNAGFAVERFDDIVYRHDKASNNRAPALVHRMDLRNNLILAHRYLPAGLREAYAADWSQRYGAIARAAGHTLAALKARWEAWWWARREAKNPRTLNADAVEAIFNLEHQRRSIAQWARTHDLRRVAIADFGKNLYATYRACLDADLTVTHITDNGSAFAGMTYRGLPIESDATLPRHSPAGVVVSNINPAQIQGRVAALQQRYASPVLTLWSSQTMPSAEAPHRAPSAAA